MSDFGNHIHVGLREPESMLEKSEQGTPAGMRVAIYNGLRDSALIWKAWHEADLRGLTGEDRYTLIAYYALIQLEATTQKLLEHMHRCPHPPLMFTDRKPP